MADKRLGPFKIKTKLSNSVYELDLPLRYKRIHPVFNISQLLLATTDEIPGRVQDPPPPIEIEGEEEYEVKQIRCRRHWVEATIEL